MIHKYLVWFMTNHFPDSLLPESWELGYKIEIAAFTAADALTQAPLDIARWLLPINHKRSGEHQSYWGEFVPTRLDRITKIEPIEPENES